MDYEKLSKLKKLYIKKKSSISKETAERYLKEFSVLYTHESTAIEGNTLTLAETKAMVIDGISVGGKTIREIYEVLNHERAFRFVEKCILRNKELNDLIVKDIHALTMENIINGGVYRNIDIYISKSNSAPSLNEMFKQIKAFFSDLPCKSETLNEIEIAAWTHAEFTRIRPFIDGNGKTARLMMNYQLLKTGFLPVSISKSDRREYFNALEYYEVNGDISLLADIIAELQIQHLNKYISL